LAVLDSCASTMQPSLRERCSARSTSSCGVTGHPP
jgi:hypothetical protein